MDNVIWIFGDQHRAQALGCAGDPNVRTPNLDSFAAQGLHLTGAVSGSPLCGPFRGCLLSGQYAHRSVAGHEDQLPPPMQTVAHAFAANGYDSAYFGKWHLDGFHESTGRAAFHLVPPDRRGGFKEWIGYENNNAPFDCWVHGTPERFAQPTLLEGFETDTLTDLFVDYLKDEKRRDTPFFSVLSVQPPHNPYVAPTEWMERHPPASIQLRPNVPINEEIRLTAQRDLAGYYAMIENLDWNFGRIIAALDEAGLTEKTHVFFFSDHGDMHGSHGHWKKTSFYEESVRVPCLYRFGLPGHQPRRGQEDWVFNHVDYAPTSLALCGLRVPAEMQGFDYSPLLRDETSTVESPDSAFIQIVRPTGHPNSIDRAWRGIITREGWKYAAFSNQPWLLFNLKNDPYEQVNLAHVARHREQQEMLARRLEDWIQVTGDSFS